jgi:predicted amidohydrolase
MKFTVALLQIAPFGNDQNRNLAKGLQYCREAKALGADLAVFPESWDDIRTAGLKTRAFENLVGIAMVNYPAPQNNGHSQAYTCVAWRNGNSIDTLIARAGEHEEILLATFDMDEIRQFRSTESWRMDYRRARTTKFTRDGTEQNR